MTIVILIAITVAALALSMVLALRGRNTTAQPEMQAVRNDVQVLRESSERTLQGLQTHLQGQMQGVNAAVQSSLSSMTAEVNRRLDAMNSHIALRLNENAAATQSSSRAAQDTFAGLQKQVGEMSEQARQLSELTRPLADLKNILSAPKLRGGFGETSLETLLAMVFAREQYKVQYRFDFGEIADAVIFFPQGMVAVDSKFSLENFRRISAAATEDAKKTARRDFLRDVKKRVDEVADKYIRPSEGTLPFALMYIPAESVYYEAIIRDEDGNDLYEYCMQRKVTPVSPNSLYAYLHTIQVGLNSLRVNQQAEVMLREIASLQLQLGRFNDLYGKLGTHLKNSMRSYDDSAREFDKLERRVEGLTGGGEDKKPIVLEPVQRSLAGGE
jgi:DNA recombination protein RmuC